VDTRGDARGETGCKKLIEREDTPSHGLSAEEGGGCETPTVPPKHKITGGAYVERHTELRILTGEKDKMACAGNRMAKRRERQKPPGTCAGELGQENPKGGHASGGPINFLVGKGASRLPRTVEQSDIRQSLEDGPNTAKREQDGRVATIGKEKITEY